MHDGGRRYGILTTNYAEVFNSTLKGACSLPITALVQLTFYRIVGYFNVRRGIAIDSVTPYVIRILMEYQKRASEDRFEAFNAMMGTYEVITQSRETRGNNKQVVQLNDGVCSCGKWEAYKIPYSHVLAVCARRKINFDIYIAPMYLAKSLP